MVTYNIHICDLCIILNTMSKKYASALLLDYRKIWGVEWLNNSIGNNLLLTLDSVDGGWPAGYTLTPCDVKYTAVTVDLHKTNPDGTFKSIILKFPEAIDKRFREDGLVFQSEYPELLERLEHELETHSEEDGETDT